MHERLQALFDEHAAPTHIGKCDAHAQLEPVTDLVALVQQQLIVYRQLLRKAKLSAGADGHEWSVEHIDQTFRLLQTEVGILEAAAMAVADGMRQLDRYLAEAKRNIEASEAGDVERVAATDVDTATLDAIATEKPAP